MAKNDAWDLDIDFDELDSEGPKAPDEGIYLAEVTKAEPKTSSGEKGKEPKAMIGVQLLLVEDSRGKKIDGSFTVFDYLVLTKAAAYRAKQMAESAKLDTKKLRLKTEDDVSDLCEDLLGSHVLVGVRHEEYQGRVQGRVDRYYTELPDTAEAEASGGRRRRRQPDEDDTKETKDEKKEEKAPEETGRRSRRATTEEPPAEEPQGRRRPSSRRG